MNLGMTTMVCGELRVTLWLHNADNPTDAEWAAALERVATLKRTVGGDLSNIRGVVLSDGGAPNTLQRGDLFVKLLEGKSRAAATSLALSNPLMRGIGTAISWLNPSFKVYPPDRFDLALEYLNLAEYRNQIIAEFDKLQSGMVANKTLAAIKSS
jgi:hypothetical protein